MTDPTLADVDRQLLLAADAWMKSEQRERAVAFNLTEEHTRRHNSGDLFKDSRAGKELREQIRDAERHALLAQDQALKIRREITGPRMRGAGKKEPVAEPIRARDPATQQLIDKRNREKAEKEARAAERHAVSERVVGVSADLPEATTFEAGSIRVITRKTIHPA